MKDKPVILVVDDQPQNIELLEAYLVPQGYEIVKASNGEEALGKLSDNQIDLILLDVMMPGMDGFEVTRRVRQDNTHRLLPIILVTVLRETEDRVKGIEAGCDDFISYPVDKMELLARVRSLLQVKAYNDLMSNYRKELESEVTRRSEELKHALENLQQDVTQRKQAEEALKESENKYRLLADNVQDVIFVLDMNLNYTYVSPSVKVLRGYEPAEVLKQPPSEILTPSSGDLAMRTLSEIMELEKSGRIALSESRTLQLEMIRKDGTTVWTEVKFSFIRDEDQRPVSILGVTRDITERKRVEDAQRESEKKYRWLVDNMADVITVMDMNLRFTYVSPSIMRMRGYTAEEATAQTFEQVMTPESLQIALKVFEEEMKLEASGKADPGRSRIVETEQYRKDGSIVWMENNLSFMRDEAQKPVGIISLTRDITERKQAEEDKQKSFEQLRKALGATVQAIASVVEMRDPYTAGHQTRVADLARSIASEMGLSRDQIDSVRIASLIHDIGKISVPAEILSRPTKLTDIEFSLIKTHAQSGYDILKDIEFPWPIARIVHDHHERMDGSGYPNGLPGDEILLESRILMVADVVEAMATHRPYRPALGIDAALEEIENNKGLLYDAEAVDVCLRLFREKGYNFN